MSDHYIDPDIDYRAGRFPTAEVNTIAAQNDEIARKVAERPTLMLPAEVAEAFRVNIKTLARWARDGKLSSTRTLGGHRRYYRDEVERMLAAGKVEREES